MAYQAAILKGNPCPKIISIYPSRLDSHKAPDEALLALASVQVKARASSSLDEIPAAVDVFDGVTGLNIGIVFTDPSPSIPDPIHTLGLILSDVLFALRACADSSDSSVKSRALKALEATC